MQEMREGTLTTTCENGIEYRLDIRYPDGIYHGGLHCGTTLEVCQKNPKSGEYEWITTRVESAYSEEVGEEDWYLTGLYRPGEIPDDLTVRI